MENIGHLRKFPREVVNLVLLSLISIILGFQILVFLSWVSSFIPLKVELGSIYSIYQDTVHPERDTFLYRIFVLSVLMIQVFAVGIYRRRLGDPEWGAQLKKYLLVELALSSLFCFTIFKIVVFGSSFCARYLFPLLIGLAIIVKIFWLAIDPLLLRAVKWLDAYRGSVRLGRIADFIVPAVIFVLLFVPQISGVVARICMIEDFMHLDAFVMSPAWAAFKGCALNVDTISQYGNGMPVMMAALSKLIGGVTYENILLLFVIMAIIYYTLIYFFLRLWLRDVCIALIGVLLVIYYTMFSYSPSYFIWQIPQTTVVRYFFDIIFFMFILKHLRTQKALYLGLAGLIAGVSLFYITDAGVYQLVSFYAYCFLLFVLPRERKIAYSTVKDISFMILYFILPVLVSMIFLFGMIGNHVFSQLFWKNSSESIQIVAKGLNAVPVLDNLKNKDFYYFFMAMGIAFTYIFSLVFIVSLNWIKKIDRQSIIVAVLSVYGLCQYHYYVLRSTSLSFLVVSVPFVLIVCFWIRHSLNFLNEPVRNRARLLFLAGIILVFFSTPAFYTYPNIFNDAQMEYEKYKNVMADRFISQDDVDLIRRLTKQDEEVCLVSSYETATLMAADRKPFFYTFNLVHSRSMKMLDFGGWKLITPYQFKRMMDQVIQEKPAHIFIEGKLVSGALPKVYYEHYQTLKVFVDYIKEHYEPFEVGKYLVALKRK